MPPRSRFRLSLTSWTFIACLLGLAGGRLFARNAGYGDYFVWYGVDLLACIFLTFGSWLTVPLIFASIITGANGLEPMRGLGRVAGKTALYIVGSSGVAALIGVTLATLLRPATGGFTTMLARPAELPDTTGADVWIVCVLLAAALAVYRNQIEETRARLLLRFATAVDETLSLLLVWAERLIPLAVGIVAFSTAAHAAVKCSTLTPPHSGVGGALLLGWLIYGGLVLPLALMVFARASPWRYARAVGAAVATALAGVSPNQMFPLTLECVRTRVGISNRVSGLVLAGCTALLRDGQALGWALAVVWVISPAPSASSGIQIFLAAWLLGCTNAAGPAAPLLLCGLVPAAAADRESLLGLGLFIELAGNAVSVFSQTCAAAVIARSEGETNFLRTPPHSALSDPLPLGTSIL
jgi:proton glutamate symport protein